MFNQMLAPYQTRAFLHVVAPGGADSATINFTPLNPLIEVKRGKKLVALKSNFPLTLLMSAFLNYKVLKILPKLSKNSLR